MTVEFSVKVGRVTLARFGEKQGRYLVMVTRGEVVQTEIFCRESILRVRPDVGAEITEETYCERDRSSSSVSS